MPTRNGLRSPYGGYRYAVKAVYGDNDVSDARLSAVEYCDMTLPLNVAVSTSTPTNEADGAAVALKGQTFGNEYTGTVGADGKLSLGEIWRDVYKVTVSKPGFTTFAAEHDATKGETATVNAVLDEYRASVRARGVEDKHCGPAQVCMEHAELSV